MVDVFFLPQQQIVKLNLNSQQKKIHQDEILVKNKRTSFKNDPVIFSKTRFFALELHESWK